MAILLEEPPIILGGHINESEDQYECETVDGIERARPPTSAREKGISSDLARYLSNYGIARNLGKAYTEVKIALSEERGLNRIPDAIFVTFGTWPAHWQLPTADAWKVVPDLCVEVLSPDDLYMTYDDKIEEYLRAGVKQVWVINPNTATFRIYDSLDRIRTLRRKDTLAGIDFLPDFELPLSEIFLEPPPAPSE